MNTAGKSTFDTIEGVGAPLGGDIFRLVESSYASAPCRAQFKAPNQRLLAQMPVSYGVSQGRLSTLIQDRSYVPTRRFIAMTFGSIFSSRSHIVSPGSSFGSESRASNQKK